jgi:hypothetical protein
LGKVSLLLAGPPIGLDCRGSGPLFLRLNGYRDSVTVSMSVYMKLVKVCRTNVRRTSQPIQVSISLQVAVISPKSFSGLGFQIFKILTRLPDGARPISRPSISLDHRNFRTLSLFRSYFNVVTVPRLPSILTWKAKLKITDR